MLQTFGKCGFSGTNAQGFSADWKRWDGAYKGYEGSLTDNYYALLAVPLRQDETQWSGGYRPPSQLS